MVRLANNDAEVFHKFKSTVIDKGWGTQDFGKRAKGPSENIEGCVGKLFPTATEA